MTQFTSVQSTGMQNSAQGLMGSGSPDAAYLHIPFCRRRCSYCDFPIAVVGDRSNGADAIARYVKMLCREIAIAPPCHQPLSTLFFGGGTPSLLSAQQLQRLLAALDEKFGIAAAAEISIEMDPGTFTLPQLQDYLAAGVNRVSLGVQAFQAELLATCGRAHDVDDIWSAIALLRQTPLVNFSLDLISGLPHQNLNHWQATLEAAIAIAPAHLSTYDLIVEPSTLFGRTYQPGTAPLPSDEIAAQMYRVAQRMLVAAGYDHYEISNYALPGFQCRHNRVYWENRPYYGFGVGAASYLQGQRFTRPRTLPAYYQWLQNEPAIPPTPHPPPPNDTLLDTLMLGLRLREGLSLATLTEQFGPATVEQILSCLQPYLQQGWVEWTQSEEPALDRASEQPDFSGQLRLSDPEGFLFSNTVLSTLFSVLE